MKMWIIAKKEINDFFSTWLGYTIITIFLTTTTLFTWILDTQFNMLNAGFADLNAFFSLCPIIFIFLLPAICIKSFSNEFKSETIEILFSKPIRNNEIIIGKFIGCFIISFFNIIPTLIYFFGIYSLKDEVALIDIGSTITSYFGLLLLSCSFISISIFSSILTNNQIVSFISSVFICFFLFFINEFADFISDPKIYDVINYIGIKEHYFSLNQGIISTKDISYFFALNYLFIHLSIIYLNKIKK